MEHKGMKTSLDSKLKIYSICSIRIRPRKWDIVEKPLQIISNLFEASFLLKAIISAFGTFDPERSIAGDPGHVASNFQHDPT